MSKNRKIETVEEFIARGGTITKVPKVERDKQLDVRKTTTGPAQLMSLDEGEFFFGPQKKNTNAKKSKSNLKIDLDALPPALRTKFVSKLKESADAEGYEEDIENLEEEGEDEEDGD